jgi:predicted ArsR family transcriptional regulator
MLVKLLELISQNGMVQPADLARQLDVSPALVEQMIDHLERVGYLQAVDRCAEKACSGCPVKTPCTLRIWRVSSRSVDLLS